MSPDPKEPRSQSIDLTGIPLFAGLSGPALQEILTRGSVRRFAPETYLWRAGEQPSAIHVVLTGSVRVVRASAGRQRVVHHETRGGTLGDVALFSGSPYPASAIAVTRVETLALTESALAAVIAAQPPFAFRLMERLAERVRLLIERLERMTSWSVQARIARHLLERDRQAQGDAFTLGMTQQALSEDLGTVREVIGRTLRELRDRGHIEPAGRGRYRVCDRRQLEQLARAPE